MNIPKQHKNTKFCYLAAVLTVFLLTSCSDGTVDDMPGAPGNDNDEMLVTLSVVTEDMGNDMMPGNASRATGSKQTVGKGRCANRLIFAVYDADNTLLTQYGNNEKGQFVDDAFGDSIARNGHYTTKLRLMRNKTYHIALWAQNSSCKAYNTDDLADVTVDYSGALCSDETRDAFCKVETFSVSPSTTVRAITLTRPFAQINVATTGAAFNGMNPKPQYTSMSFQGLANRINVLTGKVADDRVDAIFRWNSLTATEPVNLGIAMSEEFLYVDLDGDGSFKPYKEQYPTISKSSNGTTTFLTETFKYLAMCYVLVPDDHQNMQGGEDIDNGNDKPGSEDNSSFFDSQANILPNVRVEFAETLDSSDNPQGNTSSVDIPGVPVMRNFRTNLLGGFYTSNPNDNSVLSTPGVKIAINR